MPQTLAVAQTTEIRDCEAAHDSNSRKGKAIGGSEVSANSAGCHRGVARLLRNLRDQRAPAPAGAGEMFYFAPYNVFELTFRFSQFALQIRSAKRIKIRMSHGVAADLEPVLIQLPHLPRQKITTRPQEPDGDVESGTEASIPQDGRSCQQVGLTSVVKGQDNAIGGGGKALADIHDRKIGLAQETNLAAKVSLGDNVADIAGFGLAERPLGKLQFVIHEEQVSGRHQKSLRRCDLSDCGTGIPRPSRAALVFFRKRQIE